MGISTRMRLQHKPNVRHGTREWCVGPVCLHLEPNKPLRGSQVPYGLCCPHPCVCDCKQKPHSLGVGGWGGAPCLLPLLLGLLLLLGSLLPLLLLLPMDVHLALQHVPFPLCYLPRRDNHLCLASQHLKPPSPGFQLLLVLVALLKLLLLLLLLPHPMGDVGVQRGFLWI